MKTRIEQLEEALADLKAEIPDRAHDLASHARKHPLPYAITGLGLAATLGQAIRSVLRKPEPPPTLRQRVVSVAENARHRAGEFAESARDRASHFADAAMDQIHDATDLVSHKADELRHRVSGKKNSASTGEKIRDLVAERPFVTAAGVVATGFLAGLLLPPTRTEKEWFGDSAREFIDDVKGVGHDAIEEGKAAVKGTIAAADTAVRNAAAETGDMVRQKLGGADEDANDGDKAVGDPARRTGEATRGAEQAPPKAVKEAVSKA